VDADQFAQDFDDAVRTNASGDIDRETFAGKFIDHRQTFQLLTRSQQRFLKASGGEPSSP
jgi:hypothetical protein